MSDLDPMLDLPPSHAAEHKPSQTQTKSQQPLSLARLLQHYPALLSATRDSHSADVTPLAVLLEDAEGTEAAARLEDVFSLLNEQVADYQTRLDLGSAELLRYRAQLDEKSSELHTSQARLVAALLEARAPQSRSADAPAPTRHRHPDPAVFSGDAALAEARQEEYTTWRSLCLVKLAQDEEAYPLPRNRLLYIAGRLAGDAYARVRFAVDKIAASPDPAQWPEGWKDYPDLLKYLDPCYITSDVAVRAANAFEELKQGRATPFADFIAKFCRLADDCGLSNAAKVDALRRKVNAPLQDALVPVVTRPGPDDFVRWTELFRNLSNNLMDRAFRARRDGSQPVYRPAAPPAQPAPQALLLSADPMQLDRIRSPRGPISPEERERRRKNNLCLYCGNPGHYSLGCPNKRPTGLLRAIDIPPRSPSPALSATPSMTPSISSSGSSSTAGASISSGNE
jgi:hypothetical protein